MKIYGSSHAPEYDVGHLKNTLGDVDILLFTGDRDYLITEENLQRMLNVLPDHVNHISIEDYNHVDYMWAKDADYYVNSEIRSFLKQLDPNHEEL